MAEFTKNFQPVKRRRSGIQMRIEFNRKERKERKKGDWLSLFQKQRRRLGREWVRKFGPILPLQSLRSLAANLQDSGSCQLSGFNRRERTERKKAPLQMQRQELGHKCLLCDLCDLLRPIVGMPAS